MHCMCFLCTYTCVCVCVFVRESDSDSVLCVGVYVLLVWEHMEARRREKSLQLNALSMKLSAVKLKQRCESGPVHKTEKLHNFSLPEN